MADARVSGNRRFAIGLAVLALVALVVRVGYIWHWRRDAVVAGDSRYYHEAANLLAQGHGLVQPFLFLDTGRVAQAAEHPPLYILWLALFSVARLQTPTEHMVASAILGTATVVVIGLIGRAVAGRRAGLIAAGVAALYPALWTYDGALESETAAQFAVALVILAAYGWWDRPTVRRMVLLGAAIGLSVLARAELAMLLVLLVVPLVVWRSALVRRERWMQAGAACVACLVVIAPWCIYNTARFGSPVFISTSFERTVMTASCDDVFYGAFTGYWSIHCAEAVVDPKGINPDAQPLEAAAAYRSAERDYLGHHLSRVPLVMAARVGRVTGLWHLHQQAELDVFLGGRDRGIERLTWLAYFVLVPFAVGGAVVLRRRRVPVFPLTVFFVVVVLTTAAFFGLSRYRAVGEVSLVVLAAVALDAIAGPSRQPA